MTRPGVALVALVLLVATTVEAQELEPRAYSNTPVGLNFLILGYAYTTGEVGLDTSAPIEDGEVTVHSAVLAYARSFGVWGRAAKLDVVLPYAWLSGSATFAGERVTREVSGLGDPRARVSWLLYGGPALTLDEFEDYTPGFIVGASLAVTAPLGQYDRTRLVNIGTNRWSVQARDRHLPDVRAGDPGAGPERHLLHGQRRFPGRRLQRDPLYAVQGHVIYHTRLRPVGRFRRDLLRGRARHDRRRGGRAAAACPRGRDARDSRSTATTRSSSTRAPAPTRAPGAISRRPRSPGSSAGVGGSSRPRAGRAA